MARESAASEAHLLNFQGLLRDLFQFDCADLDFGIYRIMNHKRDAIEKFIANDLPARITGALDSGAIGREAQSEASLKKARQKVIAALGSGALNADGELNAGFTDTPVGREYERARADGEHRRSRHAVETDTYNHLYAFFRRYYQDGDFISKRRYSRNQRYAIPYNGEEVYLHWANSDQYYVKTAEHFHNYDWTTPYGVHVLFRVEAANVEQNNVKGDKRFFVPLAEKTTWNAGGRSVTVPFEYRPLTAAEKNSYGNRRQQDKIIARAISEIPRRLDAVPEALAALIAKRQDYSDDEPITLLEHHLRQYTRRNDSDYFVHKDLAGFLNRELDFYLKNEVLNLENMAAAGEQAAAGWFQQIRLIKDVGSEIIDFLAQIENFQKKLWEKRKFVTETQYCVTLGNIHEDLYPEIAGNDAQWDEWRKLLQIDEEWADLFNSNRSGCAKRVHLLKRHPTFVLDTRHFDADFTDRLLADFDDIDGTTDGLLIQGENFHALQLLSEKYKGELQCVHIDPPYNTQTSGFLYKNEYQHSSWLAMMQDRIAATTGLLRREAAFLCHIDENEYELLHLLFTKAGIPDGGTIIWNKKNPMLGRKGIATQHEYVLWRTWSKSSVYLRPANVRMMLKKAETLIREHGGVNREVRNIFSHWVKHCESLTGGEKAYRLIDDDGRVYRSVAMGAPELRTDPKFHVPLVHPVTKKPCPVPKNGWSRTPETLRKLLQENEIIFGKDEIVQPTRKVFLKTDSGRQLSSVLSDGKRGKKDLDQLGCEFPYCHPVSLYVELLGAAVVCCGDTVLDYFAGSGTTGHAVINLNREDGRRRRFILAEIAEHFDSVLLPRLKKVTFSPAWKDGRPKRVATPEEVDRSPRIVKYMRLESYEDVLDGVAFDKEAERLHLETRIRGYLVKYMLNWETKQSETLLDPEKLTRPFDYRLRAYSSGKIREVTADVAETFNYLIGLNVRTRRVYEDDARRYLVYRGEMREAPGRSVAVVWRETDGWIQEDFARDRQFVAKMRLGEGADILYVNGDSVISGARAVEPIFKARMFTGVTV